MNIPNNARIKSVNESFDNVLEIYVLRSAPADFFEEFPLFVSGNEVDMYPEISIKQQLGKACDYLCANHKAMFHSFDEFLKAAGL